MRWMIVALIVALAGCAESTDPIVEDEGPGPVALPDDIVFSESGALADGTIVVVPFEIDGRVRSISAEILLVPNNDAGKATNDITASLLHNMSLVASGGHAGSSASFGTGGAESILYFEERIPPQGNLSKLAGTWELRFSATGMQLSDYQVDLIVRYR